MATAIGETEQWAMVDLVFCSTWRPLYCILQWGMSKRASVRSCKKGEMKLYYYHLVNKREGKRKLNKNQLFQDGHVEDALSHTVFM